jgi:diguanylate cyclase (GGDEF)-like protein
MILKQIGQFAKENNVTIKTLHHYEKLGLIVPSYVDDQTGYRYYSDQESDDLRLILFLKDIGLSLSEINDVMNQVYDKEELAAFMVFKQKQASNDLESTSKRLFKLNRVIERLKDKTFKTNTLKELIGMTEQELFTGMYGRSTFIEEAENKFNKANVQHTPFSVMVLDLDLFKKINDQYGYDVGDIVLQRTQDEIISVLQETNVPTMLERRGGDEFTIVLETSPLESSKIATTLLNRVVGVDYSDVAEDLKVRITAGIACMTKKTKIYQDVLHDATIELYKNKRNKHK